MLPCGIISGLPVLIFSPMYMVQARYLLTMLWRSPRTFVDPPTLTSMTRHFSTSLHLATLRVGFFAPNTMLTLNSKSMFATGWDEWTGAWSIGCPVGQDGSDIASFTIRQMNWTTPIHCRYESIFGSWSNSLVIAVV